MCDGRPYRIQPHAGMRSTNHDKVTLPELAITYNLGHISERAQRSPLGRSIDCEAENGTLWKKEKEKVRV